MKGCHVSQQQDGTTEGWHNWLSGIVPFDRSIIVHMVAGKVPETGLRLQHALQPLSLLHLTLREGE